MAEYTVVASDGKTYRVQGPEGLPEEIVRMDVDRRLRKQLRDSAPRPEPAPARDSTVGEEFKRGFRQVGSGTRTGIASLLNPEEAATQGLERSQTISEDYGVAPSFSELRRTYQDEGFLSAAGELLGQIPRALASQAANVATVAAGAKTGAMLAPPTPAAKLIGGGLGATASILPMLLGSNVERQASTQLERKEDVDIDMSNALLAAAGQSAVEGVGTGLLLGKRLVKGLLGITDDAALATTQAQQALVRTAEQTRLGAAGRGIVRGAATEMPVEVAQSIMERAQAGLDVLSDDALAEYGEAAYLGGLVGGGIRGTTAAFEPGAARRQIARQEAEQAAAQPPPPAEPPAPAPPLRTVSVPLIMTGGGANGTMRVIQEPSGKLFGELVDPAGNVRMRQPLQAASPTAFLDEMAKLEKAGQPVNMETFVAAINRASVIKRQPTQEELFDTADAPVSGAVPTPSLTGEEIDAAAPARVAPTRRELKAAGQTDLVDMLTALQAEDAALATDQQRRGDLFPTELETTTSDERAVAAAMGRRQAREDESIAAMDADVEAVESQDQEQLDMLGFDEVVDTTPTPPPPTAVTPTETTPPTTPMQFGSEKAANAAARQIATELGLDISDGDLAALVKPIIRFALPRREPAIREALQKMVPAATATTPTPTAAVTPTETTTPTAPLSAADFERAVNSRIDKLSNPIVRQLLRDNGIDFRTGNEKERLRELKPVEKAILANQVLEEDLQIEIPSTFDPARPTITASIQPKREEAAAIPANVRLMDSVRRGNSSGTILQGIAQDKDVPQPLRNLARSMLRAAPNITVPVIERRYDEPDVVGEYVHPQNGDEAIYLDPRSESSAQTFLHEFVHPMTVNAIARGTPEGKRVVQLFEQYKAQHPESSAYGFTNPYEFVAEGITNPNFQSTLKRQNWWGRFVDAIRRIIGLPASQSGTVEELIDLTKRMGAAENITRTQKAAEQALTDQSPAANTKFLRVQGQQLKSASTPIKAPKFKRAVAALFDKGEEAVTRAMVWGLGLDQLNDYVQSYVKKKGPAYEPFAASFDRFSKIAGKLEGELRQFIDGITAQIARMGDWRRAHPEAYDDMNTLVYGGTLGKVDLTKLRSTYAGKPEQLKEYDRLEKVLNRLEPSGGAAIYRQMRTIYNRVFNGITQQVYDRVYSETQNVELATTIKNKFTEQMKLKGLEGYAALTRSNGKYRISYSLPGSDQKYFEIFENSADWKARQQQLLTEDGVSEKDMKPFLHGDTSVFDGIVPTSFMGDLVQTLKKNGADDNLLQAVMELGISVSPAQVVMERLAKRKETPGYTLDAFAAFQESVVGLQRKLINMKYSAQMSKEVKDMKNTRSNVATDPAIGYLIDEISSRAAYAANPNQNAISNLLTTGTYGWTLGLNVSSAIVDMLSLIVTGGYLSGRFKSRRKAHAALVKAGRDILGMGTTADVETMVTQGLEGAALQEAMQTAGINERDVTRRRVAPSMLNIDFNNPEQANKYGYLKALVDKVRDQGHSERFSDLEERAEFGESNILSKISARMGFMMSTSERYKRETGLKAFYDLALAEVAPNADPTKATKEQMEKAATEAMEMSRLLNGGSTPVTGPGFQRDNFWRVAFMYRSFAFRQMYVQVKTLYDATMNDEKSVRDAARKFGSTVLLTSGALVGVQGMPLFGPVALLLNVLAAPFVDDEEEEKFVQNMLRSNLDPLIYEGLPNALLNMGVSERASLTDLLMRDTNLPDDASFAETMAAHLGGPVVGSMERFWRGKGLIEDGQVQRGVESMVPVALSNILKSIRFVTDGAAETLRGDEVIEISPIAVVSQFMGFTPADYARTMELKSVQAGIDRRIGERKSNLYAAAYTAYRMGDSAGLAQVMQKMIEFNQQYPGEAIKNSDFKQSLRARARNSEAMLGGTLPRESRRAEWQEAADNWGVDFPE
jgi:hypothetical protein